jgi:hypothetical protein
MLGRQRRHAIVLALRWQIYTLIAIKDSESELQNVGLP